MSGRGGGRYNHGRNRGRGGGRGGGGGHKTGQHHHQQQQEKELKFTPHVQGQTNRPTFTTVRDAIVQYIQRTYKHSFDVAKSLRNKNVINLPPDKPTLTITTEMDPTKAKLEQDGYDIKYQEEFRLYLDRTSSLTQNLKKAYALIMTTYCTRIMQNRVEEHLDFHTKIEDNPIALLQAIKTLVYNTICGQYPFISMTDVLTRLLEPNRTTTNCYLTT